MASSTRMVVEGGTTQLQTDMERIDDSLDVMDRHAAELSQAEVEVQDAMRKWDREYKDTHFHSVPRPRKHLR